MLSFSPGQRHPQLDGRHAGRTTPTPRPGPTRRTRSATGSSGPTPTQPGFPPATTREIGTALANTTTYTDTPPDPATQTYSYRVIAYNQAGGSTSAPLTVPPGGPTTTTLTSSLNPSVFGDSVTFTATVSPAAATGTVTFNIDGVVVGTPQTVVGGVAAYTISSLAVGSHPVTATYSGDLAYLGSTGTITQTVSQMATTTVVAGIPNPSYVGDNVIFTATVSPAAATGTVTFNIDGVDVGTPQTVVGGMATYATAAWWPASTWSRPRTMVI